MFMGEREVLVDQAEPALVGLPDPGEPVFYPRVGHCVYRGLTEDRAAPGKKLVELEDLEEGSRILIPMERVPKLRLRPAGRALEEIQQELSSQFEQPSDDEENLGSLIEELVTDGSPRNLAKGLKRLHLRRQTTGLSREEEQTRRKIRSWLAAEVAISKDCTRAEAQAFITRILQDAMSAHRQKEREEAKERRRQVKAQKAADAATRDGEEGGQQATSDPGRALDVSRETAEAEEAAPQTAETDAPAETLNSTEGAAEPSAEKLVRDTAVEPTDEVTEHPREGESTSPPEPS